VLQRRRESAPMSLMLWVIMKHNLNARAIAGLSDELISVQTNVDKLVRDMERAIAQADAFIASLQAE
jgi:hypothetical protein